MAIPTFQAAGVFAKNKNAISPAWPTHLTNDIGLLLVQTSNQAVTAPAGWTEVTGSPRGTGTAATLGSTRLCAFWKRAASAAETAPTVADSGDHQMGVIVTFRGCITTGNPFDVTSGGVKTPASTSVTFNSVTTTVPECLIVLAVGSSTDANSTTEFSAWTNANLASPAITEGFDTSGNTGTGGGIGMAYGGKATAGSTGTSTVTSATSATYGFLTMALKPPVVVTNANFFLMF